MATVPKRPGSTRLDPEAAAKLRHDRREEHARRVAELHRALEPLAQDLRAIGVDQLSRLQTGIDTKRAPFPQAIPVLLEHLRRDYPPDVRVFIAGCLQTPEARVGWDTVLQEYLKEPASLVKSRLANVLAAVAREEDAEVLCGLVRDRANGPSRLLLLPSLVRLRDPRTKATLRELKDDPELTKEIDVILTKLNRKKH
jgi:hypothetical protein